jgi:hypothetical protein
MAVVSVGSFASRTEAELARGMLDAHGYATQVSDATDTVYGTGNLLGGGPTLLVDEQDAPAVQQLLADVETSPDPVAVAADPHRSPFDTSTRLPRARRARRVVFALVGLYGALRVAEFVIGSG